MNKRFSKPLKYRFPFYELFICGVSKILYINFNDVILLVYSQKGTVGAKYNAEFESCTTTFFENYAGKNNLKKLIFKIV
mgnify:FL=1|tara:strand:+ start:704 stop:940 length:237 start_codon:yes stop_codon:yes gene_type:complete